MLKTSMHISVKFLGKKFSVSWILYGSIVVNNYLPCLETNYRLQIDVHVNQ